MTPLSILPLFPHLHPFPFQNTAAVYDSSPSYPVSFHPILFPSPSSLLPSKPHCPGPSMSIPPALATHQPGWTLQCVHPHGARTTAHGPQPENMLQSIQTQFPSIRAFLFYLVFNGVQLNSGLFAVTTSSQYQGILLCSSRTVALGTA